MGRSMLPIMRFVQAGVLVVGLGIYLFAIVSFVNAGEDTYDWVGTYVPPLGVAIVAWNILLLIVTILVIVDSVRKVRQGKTAVLATDVFVVKLVAIPFFVVNFATMATLGLAGSLILIFGGVILLAIAITSIGLTYLAMLSTSVYGWASIVRLRRERRIGTGLAVLYTILLFIFVTDIAAGIMLFGHSRGRPIAALVANVFTLGVIVTIVGFAIAALSADWESFSLAGWINPVSASGVTLALAAAVFAIVRTVLLRRRAQAALVS